MGALPIIIFFDKIGEKNNKIMGACVCHLLLVVNLGNILLVLGLSQGWHRGSQPNISKVYGHFRWYYD